MQASLISIAIIASLISIAIIAFSLLIDYYIKVKGYSLSLSKLVKSIDSELKELKKGDKIKRETTPKFMRIPKNRRPTSPGVILLKEFLNPLGITPNDFAKGSGIREHIINGILNGTFKINDQIAHKLGNALNTTDQLWKNAQLSCDLYDRGYRGIVNIEEIWKER